MDIPNSFLSIQFSGLTLEDYQPCMNDFQLKSQVQFNKKKTSLEIFWPVHLHTQLPHFKTLPEEDRMILMKAHLLQSIILCIAWRSTEEDILVLESDVLGRKKTTLTFKFSSNKKVPESERKILIQLKRQKFMLVNAKIAPICRNVRNMKMDPTEFTLLAALAVFSDASGLVVSREHVDRIRCDYTRTLRTYVDNNRSEQDGGAVFSNMMDILSSLTEFDFNFGPPGELYVIS